MIEYSKINCGSQPVMDQTKPSYVQAFEKLINTLDIVPMESVSLRSYSDAYPCLWHG